VLLSGVGAFVRTVARVASVKMKETTVRLVELGLKAKK
jgi:hypothetical protein